MKGVISKKAAKKKATPGSFKKGTSGNPKGRAVLPPEIKAIRNGSKQQIIEAYGKYSNLDLNDIGLFPPKNLIEKGVLKTMRSFADDGDIHSMTKLWDQVHGKAVESVNLSGSVEVDNVAAKFFDEWRKRRTS